MMKFSIGGVCRILGVKPHVVRYWEQEIGVLSPEKDIAGRRVFTSGDLQLLFRIKYLVHERKYTVEDGGKDERKRILVPSVFFSCLFPSSNRVSTSY